MYKAPSNTNANQYGYNSNTANNNNPWLNSNSNNPYGSNAGNAWTPNRDANTNNINPNANNNPYSNSPYLFNHSYRMPMSSVVLLLSLIISVAFYL